MAKDTRERILAAALEMFSERGFAGTNIRELAQSLGLVKSGLYKHYQSKEDIWNALLDRMIAYYGEHFGSPERLPPVPDTPEGLVTMTMQMVNFTVHDEKVVMTRKVLTLEQFRDDRARELATKHFLTGLTEIFITILLQINLHCPDALFFRCLTLGKRVIIIRKKRIGGRYEGSSGNRPGVGRGQADGAVPLLRAQEHD